MHSLGVEPKSFPWKGKKLPLLYEYQKYIIVKTKHLSMRAFQGCARLLDSNIGVGDIY